MKSVLVAPLDWGLGHTTRCVPIISALKQEGAKVIFAGTTTQIEFIKKHFSELDCETISGYDVSYSGIWPQWIKVGFQSLRLAKTIKKENSQFEAILNRRKIDIVISDNRYGLYNKQVKSIFITHQISIPSPMFKQRINSLNHELIEHFDECWIPDDPKINLSGELSSGDIKKSFVGLLSRFVSDKKSSQKKYDVCCLLSGPEPQRKILETLLIDLLSASDFSVALIRGCKGKLEVSQNIEVFEIIGTETMQSVLEASDHVICRSGYSSLMDLAFLNKKMFLIPTPGQPEQEYLAQYLKEQFGIPFVEQKKLFESKNILDLSAFKAMNIAPNKNLLQKEISRILMD